MPALMSSKNNTTSLNTTTSINIYDKIIGGYAIFLAIFGTFGNILSFTLCCRKRLRRTPIFIFLSFKSLNDIVPLLQDVSTFWYVFTGYNIADIDLWSCRLTQFFFQSSTETSVYIMVSNNF